MQYSYSDVKSRCVLKKYFNNKKEKFHRIAFWRSLYIYTPSLRLCCEVRSIDSRRTVVVGLLVLAILFVGCIGIARSIVNNPGNNIKVCFLVGPNIQIDSSAYSLTLPLSIRQIPKL